MLFLPRLLWPFWMLFLLLLILFHTLKYIVMFQRESGEDNPVPEGSMFKRPSWSREFPGEIYRDSGQPTFVS